MMKIPRFSQGSWIWRREGKKEYGILEDQLNE